MTPKRKGPGRSRARRSFDTWQIIYIDLMTNVMIFFVVLWAIQSKQQKSGSAGTGLGNETVKMVNLPGDVLFPPGKAELSASGQQVFGKLFAEDAKTVLNFDTGSLLKRLLVIHGHTDSDGRKEQNLELGYQRALAAFREIRKYSTELTDHVVICSHADNTPSREVPTLSGKLSPADEALFKEAKAKNRRITIEDKLLGRPQPGQGKK